MFNQDEDSKASTAAAAGRIAAQYRGTPTVVVAGPTKEGDVRYATDDPTLLEKTKHVRAKKETMNEFYARVGLGKAQILAMSKDEISNFVAVVSQNEQVPAPRYRPIDEFIDEMERSLTHRRVITLVG